MTENFKVEMSGIDLNSMYDDTTQPHPDPAPPRTTLKSTAADVLTAKEKGAEIIAAGSLNTLAKSAEFAAVGGPNTLMSPLTGALVNTSNIDQLIEAAIETQKALQELKAFDRVLREKALSLTEGDKKTRRLRGKEKQVVLEGCGDVYPVGSILKEAWIAYPQFRDQFMRIDRIALKLVEFNKLKSLKADDRAFNTFTKMLMRAVETGTPALPTIKAENVRTN